MSAARSIIILSEKASGSSACQNLLAKLADLRHVARTRHYQNETLYWTKAASILGRPQIKMVDSEVPIPQEKARTDLITLLQDNLEGFEPPADDRDLIFSGWDELCRQHAPVFLEKSPHHLCQWSALELIVDYMNRSESVDMLLIGLVRNPMDTLYSNWREWRSEPEKVEQQWLRAYRNLLRLKDLVGDRLVLIRYEDMVSSLDYMKPVFDFCDVSASEADADYLHSKSLQKWKKDARYGFNLTDETLTFASQFGYGRDELVNEPNALWPLTRKVSRAVYVTTGPAKKSIRRTAKKILTGLGLVGKVV